MKSKIIVFTLTFIIGNMIMVACFGQMTKGTTITKQWDLVINFDMLNGAHIKEASSAAKYARQTDSLKWVIVRSMLQLKEVDFSRISDKGDSLVVTPEGIFLKFKHPKK